LEQNIEAVKQWLADKNTTLWMSWDLTQDDELELAARWFMGSIYDYNNWRVAQAKKHAPNVEFDVVV
jgi:hypothetical protein